MGERRTGRGIFLGGLIALLLPAATLGVAMSAEPLPAPADASDALHEVIRGDNLHLIAAYYYGDARQWERIWRANRWQVHNPNRIEQGMLLRIPQIVAPDEPYADFVARVRRAPSPAGAPATPIKSKGDKP